VHPVRERIPVYLAAVGPKNLELTGEIADGWLAVFFAPEHAAGSLDPIRAGRAKAGAAADLAGYDVVPTVPLIVGDDVAAAADAVRGYAALYIGGMGSREQNFYNALARRMGFDRAADEVQDRYLARDYAGAQAAVPFEFVDQTSLLGPVDRIADRMQAYAQVGVTTLNVAPHSGDLNAGLAALRTAVDALDRAGVGS
jgi:alkanesulfonate monooxygenase SsuD/methylene tetrahydromethanopterin reductase-like flavin-dependent oxidoreductase (luciferase family)